MQPAGGLVRDLADYDRAFGLLDAVEGLADGEVARTAVKTKNDAGSEALKQLTYLAGALKTPRITESAARLADHARDAGWTHEEYLAAVLDREVAARNASGAQLRIRAAGFAARKALEEFDWAPTSRPPADRRPRVRRVSDRGTQRRAARPARHRQDPPGHRPGDHRRQRGHRVLFATATEWVTRLTDAHRAGRLPQELARLRRYGLVIVDEVGYLPFDQEAANLFFQLVSSRYEHASRILTSNLPFSGWGGVFGDQAVAAAMIDRVVHHADVLTVKGATYRLRNRGIDTLPSIRTQATAD
jgi:DNA replication protein DnaC